MKRKTIILLLITLSICAAELDLGIGVGYIYYPDYLGAKHLNSTILPFPFIDYHSEKLDIDQDGLKQQLLQIDGLSLRLSMNGSLPIKSSGVREGMENLNPSIEIGPALVYHLYKSDGVIIKLDFPIRAVISSDFKTNIKHRGYKCDPKITLDYKFNGYLFQFQTGGVWADSRFHNYIYGVNSSSVTANRKLYIAEAGYSGYKTSIGISKKFKNIWIGVFMREYNLEGAVYSSSPLKEQNHALYGGVFVSYLFNN